MTHLATVGCWGLGGAARTPFLRPLSPSRRLSRGLTRRPVFHICKRERQMGREEVAVVPKGRGSAHPQQQNPFQALWADTRQTLPRPPGHRSVISTSTSFPSRPPILPAQASSFSTLTMTMASRKGASIMLSAQQLSPLWGTDVMRDENQKLLVSPRMCTMYNERG